MRRLLAEQRPDFAVMVLDKGDSGRKALFPDYKATRKPMPDELRASIPAVRRAVEALGVAVVAFEGFEADDAIGTLANQALEHGMDVVCVTGDKDYCQLVGPRLRLASPARSGAGGAIEWTDTSNVEARLGVPAHRVVDFLALVGDTSDNVPGARGIGEKGALKLIAEYTSIDAMIEAGPFMKGKTARAAFTEHADVLRLSRQLVTLRTDLDLGVDVVGYAWHGEDAAALGAVARELEMAGLVREMEKAGAVPAGGAAEPEPPEQLPLF
jgi:DNA polymerase I